MIVKLLLDLIAKEKEYNIRENYISCVIFIKIQLNWNFLGLWSISPDFSIVTVSTYVRKHYRFYKFHVVRPKKNKRMDEELCHVYHKRV